MPFQEATFHARKIAFPALPYNHRVIPRIIARISLDILNKRPRKESEVFGEGYMVLAEVWGSGNDEPAYTYRDN
jgi:hypothetical protein